MRENLKFVIRVTFIHCMTYVLCGIIFSALFHYDELYQQGTIKYFMRPVDSFSTLLGPAFQTVRGLLFGFILLLFKDNILLQKHGWLKLWAITAGLGIVNTPGPAPCSIEGIIYTQLPLEFHIKGAPELLIQTLLFSYLVANPERFQLLQLRLRKYRTPLVSAVSAWVLFSLSGVILALILHLNIKEGMTDFGAYIVMLIAVLSVFFRQQVVSVRSFPSEAYCFSTLLLYGARCHTDLIQPIGRFPVCFFPYAWNQCDFCRHSVLYQLHGLPPQ